MSVACYIHEQPMQWHLYNDHKAMPPPKADKMPKLTISLHLVNAKMRHVGIKIGKKVCTIISIQHSFYMLVFTLVQIPP